MSTLWDETVEMMMNSCRPGRVKATEMKFRAINPQLAIEFMQANPEPKTIVEMMAGLNGTKPTIRRIMIHLEEIGMVGIDRTRRTNDYLYFLIGD